MKIRTGVTGLILAGLAAASLAAQKPADKPKAAAAAAPDEKAQMEAMVKAGTPGDQHKKLEHFVGTWDAKVTMWDKPGAPPKESAGTSETKSVLGGRFVEEHFDGTFMDQPFSGMGITGYDNVRKKYVSTWADTMSTGVMVSTGTADKGGKSMAFTASMPDPMTGKMTPMKEKLTIVDDDHHTFEMWMPGPDGKLFRMMEITYARKK